MVELTQPSQAGTIGSVSSWLGCGPRDNNQSWQGGESVTPMNRFFGFTHVLDGGWVGDHYCRSWQLLKLHNYGPVIDIDVEPAPFGNSRRLITNADVGKDAGRAHGSVTPGKNSPKDKDGKYLFESVLKYLHTHPVDQIGAAVPLSTDCKMIIKK